jgi:hypothetical protein
VSTLFEGVLHDCDIELFRTETLIVWVRRPDPHHTNWWLCYYSTDADEALNWDWAIRDMCKAPIPGRFHQGCWPVDHEVRHPGCCELFPQQCPGVAQAWEMLGLGCSQWALHFPDAPLDELRELGDPGLETLLALVPGIRAHAER